jgi:hypothetical protein
LGALSRVCRDAAAGPPLAAAMPNVNVAKKWIQYAKDHVRVHVEGKGYGTLM